MKIKLYCHIELNLDQQQNKEITGGVQCAIYLCPLFFLNVSDLVQIFTILMHESKTMELLK